MVSAQRIGQAGIAALAVIGGVMTAAGLLPHTTSRSGIIAAHAATAPVKLTGPKEVAIDEEAQFEITGIEEDAVARVSWSFGDGSYFGGALTASHSYAMAGSYTVTVTILDSDGTETVQTFTVQVIDADTSGSNDTPPAPATE